jgi:hypothetical protein
MIDHLHEKAEDYDDNDASMPEEERQYREILRLTIGELKVSKDDVYWSTDDNLRRLLSYRPSIEVLKLIRRPMSYLSENKSIFDDESLERERYFIRLQKRLIEYFIDKYRV